MFCFTLSHQLQKIELKGEMNKCFNSFQHCFQLVFDHYAPMKVYCHKSNLKPKWLTNNLKNLINKRNKAHDQWSKDRNNASLRMKLSLFEIRS